jgi:hypothetical protein
MQKETYAETNNKGIHKGNMLKEIKPRIIITKCSTNHVKENF